MFFHYSGDCQTMKFSAIMHMTSSRPCILGVGHSIGSCPGAMTTPISKENLKRMKFCVQHWMESCPQTVPILITALVLFIDFQMTVFLTLCPIVSNFHTTFSFTLLQKFALIMWVLVPLLKACLVLYLKYIDSGLELLSNDRMSALVGYEGGSEMKSCNVH